MSSQNKTFAQWRQQAAGLQIEGRAYIAGQYQDSADGMTFVDASPIDGRPLANIADCDEATVNHAVAAAEQAFQAGDWARRTPAQRKATLLRLADLVAQHQEELALLESLDTGKTIHESLDMDMQDVQTAIRYYAEAIDKIAGEIAPTGDAFHGMITLAPLGVVAVMTPWNNPLMIACWKIAPALAMGNSVVFKPSEKAPLTGIRFAELTRQAGIPDGVFNVVTGGAQVGKTLALHPRVRAMAFTGSTQVAKQLLIYAGQSNMKRTFLEGGGKNAHIIFADTPDLARAARFAALGFCANQGAVCASGTRLLVQSSIKAQFLALLLEELKKWQPGHPLDPATAMGPLIDVQHQANVLRYIESARAEGASILCGGQADNTLLPGGYVLPPTLIDNATPEMTASQNEIFGPVASLMTFEDEEQAIQLANDSEYGLTVGFWTPDIAKVHRVARQLEAGTVWVNHFLTRDILSPFGGFKQSGIGRDLSLHALPQYGEMKATWIALQDIAAH
ncbi:aldehyde dehydrogenase PuuC [Serratia marcescens]|uniref:aldehyde dehydrogenase family protein n=1 Tax=Serratia marcescens TaxID=615 RepID=UPI000CDDC094|nr:aldehyde dehydrogenase family protein [Serratia marcescens]POX26234.1 aldehyde dehydrogenase PuuC [Serratia marcescens]